MRENMHEHVHCYLCAHTYPPPPPPPPHTHTHTHIHTHTHTHTHARTHTDKDRLVLARYSKNYLPILFNLYTTTPTSGGVGPALLQCVGAYVSITEQPLVDGLFGKAVEKVKQEDIAKETRSVLKLPQTFSNASSRAPKTFQLIHYAIFIYEFWSFQY